MSDWLDDLTELWWDVTFAEQEAWIRARCGDDAAEHANYGWGTDRSEFWLYVETKVYGHGVLRTVARRAGSDVGVTHEFSPFEVDWHPIDAEESPAS